MSLIRIDVDLHGEGVADREPEPRTALVFVLNSAFLRPFHVLAYSLARQRTLTRYPIIVISEDKAVFDDPLVKVITDHPVLVGKAQISEFANISSENVREDLRKDWIAKYTFLKWLIYQDYGYERHVYLDADIVALGDCDHLARLGEHDIYGAPVFKRHLIVTKEGSKRPIPDREARIGDFVANGNIGSLNSGVLVINRRAMQPEFRAGLIATAESRPYSVEQGVVRDFVRASDAYSFGPLSPNDNFNHGFLAAMSIPAQIRCLGAIRLLHFVGADKKPWDPVYRRNPRRIERMTDSLWSVLDYEARNSSDLLRRAAKRLDRLQAAPSPGPAVADHS